MEASDSFVGSYLSAAGNMTQYFDQKPTDNNQFTIDDLLNFPKEDEVMNDAFFDSIAGNSADSSTVTAVDSCNSSVSGGEAPFSGYMSCRTSFTDAQFSTSELCVPYEDLADLEWLSNFVEESFSSDDMQNLQFIPTATTQNSPTDTSSSAETAANKNSPIFTADVAVPGKARSKRSRAAPCDWSSRLLHLSPANFDDNIPNTTSLKKRENSLETPGRRCLHCASEKTPQWRTGPLGPKTLCNACGVRYKSGRLVPEYRPAASPTFVSARHSNSHRKVMELRRQKDLRAAQQQLLSQSSIFGISNGDDYLFHRQSIQDFRDMV